MIRRWRISSKGKGGGKAPEVPVAVPDSELRQIPAALEAARTGLDVRARCALFRFESNFPAFNGHFPGQPILPAVVSVLAATQLLAALEDREVLLNTNDLTRCVFRTNHASNYLPLAGTLSRDKTSLLGTIDEAQSRGLAALRPEAWRAL